MTATVGSRVSTGRVVPAWQASLLVVEGFWTWYRRHWRSSLVSNVGMPLFMLVALGIGFGSLVRTTDATGGVPYLSYLAPALLVTAALQNATVEATWPIQSAFKWQRTYWAITATPVTSGQVVGGQLLWIACRVALSGLMYLAVIVAFGAMTGWGMLPALLFATLCAMAFAAPVAALSASITNESNAFNSLFRFVVLPMTLFSGTFFPLSQLPVWAQALAWVTPLWHGNELARGAALGTLGPLPALGHVGYLVVLLVAGVLLARWRFAKRLAE